MKMTKTLAWGVVLVLGMVSSGCVMPFFAKKVKAPSVQLASLKYSGSGPTNSKLSVAFNVRNVNPTPMVVESFRYELTLDKTKLGSGYYATRMELASNAEQKVTSLFELNSAKMPTDVQALLAQPSVRATVHCKFFLAGGEIMNYTTHADVGIQK